MDPRRFDTLTKTLTRAGTRRHLVRLLTALPLGVTLTSVLGNAPDTAAKDDDHGSSHRRRRRKAKHRHQTGNNKEHRKGKRKGKGKGKGKGKDTDTTPTSCTKRTCSAGSCGSQPDGCGGTLSCGGCTGNQLCVDGVCQPCDVCQPADSCSYDTVQDAVADPNGPSTVRVCPGTYVEDSGVPGFLSGVHIARSLQLIGAGDGSDAASTILRPENPNRVVVSIISLGPPLEVTLERLHITGGTSTNGSGVLVQNATATIAGCTITDNHRTGSAGGGGLLTSNADVTLTATKITANSAPHSGGIRMDSNSEVTLDSLSQVTNNTATAVGGGGIFNDGGTLTLQAGSRVTGNQAPNNTGGGIVNFGTVLPDPLDASTLICNNTQQAGGTQCVNVDGCPNPPDGICPV